MSKVGVLSLKKQETSHSSFSDIVAGAVAVNIPVSHENIVFFLVLNF